MFFDFLQLYHYMICDVIKRFALFPNPSCTDGLPATKLKAHENTMLISPSWE